jgi:restriction system protein
MGHLLSPGRRRTAQKLIQFIKINNLINKYYITTKSIISVFFITESIYSGTPLRRSCNKKTFTSFTQNSMARPGKIRSRQKGRSSSMQETAIRVGLLGLAFLVAPLLCGGSEVVKVIGSALRMPGWFLFGAGLVLTGVAYLRNRPTRSTSPTASTSLDTVRDTNQTAANDVWSLSDRQKYELSANLRRNSQRHTAAPTAAARVSHFPNSSLGNPLRRLGPDTEMTTARPALQPGVWSHSVFVAIEWRRFEAVCEALFAQAGLKTESRSRGADGGVDIWLYSANADGLTTLAHCKQGANQPVGIKEMREFFRVMASHQIRRGTYATASYYTAEARQFAKVAGINTLDSAALLALIATRTPEQQAALLTVAFKGDYWRPTCGSCGVKTVERKPAHSGPAFWGCNNHPRCKTTFKMTAP